MKKALAWQTGAKLWIDHDFAQSATLPRLPQYVE